MVVDMNTGKEMVTADESGRAAVGFNRTRSGSGAGPRVIYARLPTSWSEGDAATATSNRNRTRTLQPAARHVRVADGDAVPGFLDLFPHGRGPGNAYGRVTLAPSSTDVGGG